jgi:hypothetical protein
MRLLPPPRGLIFDRTGEPLAINRNNFRAMATSDRGRGAEILVDRLDQILNLGDTEKQRLLRELRRSRNAQPVVVRENLGWEEVARLEFNAPDLPGVFLSCRCRPCASARRASNARWRTTCAAAPAPSRSRSMRSAAWFASSIAPRASPASMRC